MTLDPGALIGCVFDRSPVGIALTAGPRHGVLAANRALLDALGRGLDRPAEVLGRGLPDCLGGDAGLLAEALDRALAGRGGRQVITEHHRPTGELVALRWSA
ncbi:MAG: PAS domain-containing protein, partial [Planctomycetota bacterium]|nr:PAS domain-containing protein [Planctomycetota bacterium]